MTIDWNWFFAAFAQSGAALIGIIAAFIISKLLGESDRVEDIKSSLNKLIIEFNDVVRRLDGRYFLWYDKQSIKSSYKLKEAIKKGEFAKLNEKEKLKKLDETLPGLYGTDVRIEALDELIIQMREEGPLSLLSSSSKELYQKLSDERELIENLRVESKKLIEKFMEVKSSCLIARSRLKPLKLVIWMLIVGYIFSVAYPLHFLPMQVNDFPKVDFSIDAVLVFMSSIKGLLIILLTLLIEGILLYFLMIIIGLEIKLRDNRNDIKDDYLNIKVYSAYFN